MVMIGSRYSKLYSREEEEEEERGSGKKPGGGALLPGSCLSVCMSRSVHEPSRAVTIFEACQADKLGSLSGLAGDHEVDCDTQALCTLTRAVLTMMDARGQAEGVIGSMLTRGGFYVLPFCL